MNLPGSCFFFISNNYKSQNILSFVFQSSCSHCFNILPMFLSTYNLCICKFLYYALYIYLLIDRCKLLASAERELRDVYDLNLKSIGYLSLSNASIQRRLCRHLRVGFRAAPSRIPIRSSTLRNTRCVNLTLAV